MKAIGIDHLVLRVRDLDVSVSFYRDVLGLMLDRRRDELGLVHLRAGHSLVDLLACPRPLGTGKAEGTADPNMDHLCLRVAPFNVGNIVALLEASSVEIGEIDVRYGSTGEGTSIYLSDPDGNGLELRA